jgi:hypothetical protein
MALQSRHAQRFAFTFLLYSGLVLLLATVLRDRLDENDLGQALAWLGLLAVPPLYLLAWQWFRAGDELQQRIFGESVLIAVFASGFLTALVQLAVVLGWLPEGLASPAARDLGGLLACAIWYAAWCWRRRVYR